MSSLGLRTVWHFPVLYFQSRILQYFDLVHHFPISLVQHSPVPHVKCPERIPPSGHIEIPGTSLSPSSIVRRPRFFGTDREWLSQLHFHFHFSNQSTPGLSAIIILTPYPIRITFQISSSLHRFIRNLPIYHI